MRTVLDRLGVSVTPVQGHHNHFHIYLRPPQALVLRNLEDGAPIQPLANSNAVDGAVSRLTEGDLAMLFDVSTPPVPPQTQGYVQVVQAGAGSKPSDKSVLRFNAAYESCSIVETQTPPGRAEFAPGYALFNTASAKVARSMNLSQAIVTVLEPPKFGVLTDSGQVDREGGPVFIYDVNSGTPDGTEDRIVFLIETNGKRVKVVERLIMSFNSTPESTQCSGKDFYIRRISSVSEETAPPPLSYAELNPYLLLKDGLTSGVTYRLAALNGQTLGQTNGAGLNTQITLDTNAAGHNWFVDPTPLDNTDDYLPTSNPNIWQAKAGSDAAGKMDMLSVLLHEYGHALGLEHSADADDFMAATLQPGERRLPSAQELTLMSQLVAQLKASTALADGSTPNTPSDPISPTGPGNPTLPSLPLGALLIGRLALGRRPEDAQAFAQQGSQALFSANPTLQGGSLSTLQNWATQGSVVASSGSGGAPIGATLRETGTTQTRLNQVFMVGPQDRYLAFTLSNLALDDASNGPDDAFEVGLLNANTGASLTGTIGLTHSDSLLNLQAGNSGLAQLAAQGVTHTTRADGSRTYLVDLSGIARDADGKVAVNLSFDLIGFGSTAATMGSHVQVSNVRLLSQINPTTVDDSASGLEDTALTIAALANDENIDPSTNQNGTVPVVVAAPAHGAVVVNANGTFTYTPQANYFGADSFTYKLSDGTLDSNVSTVSLSITPVNDAPVAADLSVSTLEDTPIAINLIATDVDTASASLQFIIQTQPQHGSLTLNADGSYSYLGNKDFFGADSFTYKVSDGELDSNLATVSIAVTAVNDAPTLGDQSLTTAEDTAFAGNLLASAADVDSATLSAVIVAGPLHGSLVVNADGTFSYQANTNYFGADSFTYKVNDGELDSGLATVSLTITAVNDVPVATDAAVATNEDTTPAPGWSACCVIAPAHPSPWTGSNSAGLIWSTAAAKATQSRCSPTNTRVNWC